MNWDAEWVKWYSDVNIRFGALWLRDHGDYADVLEVTDLESAAGAAGAVLIERGSVGLYGYPRSISKQVSRVREALESCGAGVQAWREIEEGKYKRLAAWAALWSYGAGDREYSDTVIDDEDSWRERDGQAYWSEPIAATVDGEAGLREYIWRKYGVPVNEEVQA